VGSFRHWPATIPHDFQDRPSHRGPPAGHHQETHVSPRGNRPNDHRLVALTTATIPARIAAGNSGQASMTAVRLGSAVTLNVVATLVAVGVRIESDSFGCVRASEGTTPFPSETSQEATHFRAPVKRGWPPTSPWRGLTGACHHPEREHSGPDNRGVSRPGGKSPAPTRVHPFGSLAKYRTLD
jgi:hypothetical protein